jgi:D-alanine-D-alanine ligase
VYEVSYDELLNHANPFTVEFKPKNNPLFKDIKSAIASVMAQGKVFLLALHGGDGENGYIQGLLEQCSRPYTGSDAQGSAVAFNKIATKEALLHKGFLLAPQLLLKAQNIKENKNLLLSFLQEHGPVIVKPVCGGSSLGVFFISNEHDISRCLNFILKDPRDFMAEKIIDGREITVGVVEMEQGLMALIPTEIILSANRSFDYEGKYLGHGSQEITPAQISDLLTKEAQDLSIKAHQGLSLSGYSRTDLILAEKGFYYLETNTLPGLTSSSFIPQQLQASGIKFGDFLQAQVSLALKRAVKLTT